MLCQAITLRISLPKAYHRTNSTDEVGELTQEEPAEERVAPSIGLVGRTHHECIGIQVGVNETTTNSRTGEAIA